MKKSLIALSLAVGGAASAEPASPAPTPALVVDGEVFARAVSARQDDATTNQLTLDRAELGLAWTPHPRWGLELRTEAIRSAAPESSTGIDGDSLVLRLKRAAGTADVTTGPLTVRCALGLIADPWIAGLDAAATTRGLGASASEGLLRWDSADLGLRVDATWGPATLTLAAMNGEGLRYPERNDGTTTMAMLTARLPAAQRSAVVKDAEVALVARDSSYGPGAAREHRVGGRVAVVIERVDAQLEVVRALGLRDQPDVDAWAIGGALHAAVTGPLEVTVGGDWLGTDHDGSQSVLRAALGGRLPFAGNSGRNRARLWLVVERDRAGGALTPVPGSPAGDVTYIGLSLDVRAVAAITKEPMP